MSHLCQLCCGYCSVCVWTCVSCCWRERHATSFSCSWSLVCWREAWAVDTDDWRLVDIEIRKPEGYMPKMHGHLWWPLTSLSADVWVQRWAGLVGTSPPPLVYITSDIDSTCVIIYDSVKRLTHFSTRSGLGAAASSNSNCLILVSRLNRYTHIQATRHIIWAKKYMLIYLSRSCGLGDFSSSSCNCWDSESSLPWEKRRICNSDGEQYTYRTSLSKHPLSVLLYLSLQFCFHFFHVSTSHAVGSGT